MAPCGPSYTSRTFSRYSSKLTRRISRCSSSRFSTGCRLLAGTARCGREREAWRRLLLDTMIACRRDRWTPRRRLSARTRCIRWLTVGIPFQGSTARPLDAMGPGYPRRGTTWPASLARFPGLSPSSRGSAAPAGAAAWGGRRRHAHGLFRTLVDSRGRLVGGSRQSGRVAEQQAEHVQGLNGPSRITDAAGVDALLPYRQGIPQILLPRLGQQSPRPTRP